MWGTIVRLFVGYDDFGSVVEKQLDFVDKSLFIQAILSDPNQVIQIIRPHRFGKSFNLSMLQYFFAPEVLRASTKNLFDGLEITKIPEAMAHQGQHPVIFISLKDLNQSNYASFYINFVYFIKELYQEHRFVLNSPHLNDYEKDDFKKIMLGTADEIDYKKSLKFLTLCLHTHYGKKPFLLIDEYDAPLQSAYLHGYYEQALDFVRGFLSPVLKSNLHLEKAVLTGILCIAKENLYTELNNIQMYSVFSKDYCSYFGFTAPEIKTLFEKSGLSNRLDDAKHWYNGYQIDGVELYNPWSIVHCIKNQGQCQPYWSNTSENDLVKKLLLESSVNFKHDFEHLLAGHTFDIPLTDAFAFSELNNNETIIWSFLLMTGYLKAVSAQLTDDGLFLCTLQMPNLEVRNVYSCFIKEWLSPSDGTHPQ
ncbi:MAG: AAA family ATPase [Gammaproteobacteria bacterium]|nr:AAA family ATPase [Gammaproteobacteria bacterium]